MPNPGIVETAYRKEVQSPAVWCSDNSKAKKLILDRKGRDGHAPLFINGVRKGSQIGRASGRERGAAPV